MQAKPTLQEHADKVVAPEYRQPLKTIQEAVESIGWAFEDKPLCCGKPVKVHSLIGAYFAECLTCGRFVRDITGPIFNEQGNTATFIDSEKFADDTDWNRTWIAGQRSRAA